MYGRFIGVAGALAVIASALALSPRVLAKGTAGPTLVIVRKVVAPGETKVVEARCPRGKVLSAGGFRADPPLVVHQSSLGNLASPPSRRAWRVVATNPRTASAGAEPGAPSPMKVVIAEAICS